MSCRIRLLQDVMRDDPQIPKHCTACGQEIDKQGAHLRKCQQLQKAGLRQKLRNPIHKATQIALVRILTT